MRLSIAECLVSFSEVRFGVGECFGCLAHSGSCFLQRLLLATHPTGWFPVHGCWYAHLTRDHQKDESEPVHEGRMCSFVQVY
jgi:hypothetical protein